MSKINILAISPDPFGVGKFRMVDPFNYISDNFKDDVSVDVVYDTPFNDHFFEKYDIVIFHSFIHKINHEININRIKWLKEKGIVTIMDIDDYWAVDQRHPLYRQALKNNISKNKIDMLKLADYVTTTTPIYKKTLMNKLGVKKVEVFPNAVNEDEEQFKPSPIASNKIRFGWLGGSSHLHDLKLLESAISQTHDNYKGKVQFVLCGFDLRGNVTEIDREGKEHVRPLKPQESVWYKYENIFTKNYNAVNDFYKNYLHSFADIPFNYLNESYVRRWTREVSSYATNYNYFDVSLAPLVDSVFNNNKSQLKVIEAGFHKKPIIASEVEPYTLDLINGKNSLLVPPTKNHKLWTKHMKTLLDNPNMIEDLGNNLYETVKDTYSLKKVCKDRVEFFKSIINK